MNSITNKDEVYQIYLKNLEYINKNIKRKNKHYGTKFDEKMAKLWFCDGELIIKNVRGIEPNEHFNERDRLRYDTLEFTFNDGYLVSNFLLYRECKNYKFKCIY